MKNEIKDEAFESQPKWQTIVSLVFAFCTILPFILPLIDRNPGRLLTNIIAVIYIVFYFGGFLFGATAFILGIMGLKYRKNALAITAIVVSVVGFISNMYFYDISRSQPLP